jgi:uncharacterized DUF497 family protein
VRFTWSTKKAASNKRDHGVTFEEARDAVLDPLAVRDFDGAHDDGREWLIGCSGPSRTLFVIVLEKADGQVTRIISARLATSHERRLYEEG